MSEESDYGNLSPHELIESLRSDIEILKESLDQYSPCMENITLQLWELHEVLKKANAGLEKIIKRHE